MQKVAERHLFLQEVWIMSAFSVSTSSRPEFGHRWDIECLNVENVQDDLWQSLGSNNFLVKSLSRVRENYKCEDELMLWKT